jgi:hypothetical protein
MENPSAPSATAADAPWWAALDPRRHLAARAVAVVGGGAVVFTVGLAWAAGAALERRLEGPLGASLEALAAQCSAALDRTAAEHSRALQFAAGLAPLRLAATPAAERRRALDALLDSSPDFAWVGFAEAGGRIVSATQGFLENTDAAGAAWFRGAREQPYAGEVREVPELAREIRSTGAEPPRFLALAAPVTAPEGQFAGVLAAQLDWAWARDVAATVLTDTARRARVSLTVYNAKGESLLDSGTSGWTEPPPAPDLADRRSWRGFFRETVSGDTEYLTGFARSRGFRDFRGLGTLVAVRQPATELHAAVAALRRGVIGWGLALAAALATTSGLVAHRLAHRLRAVGAAADRIRAGDALSLMPRARGEAELDRMCGALDAMVADFRAKQEQLAPEKARPEILPERLVKDRDASKYV